MNNADEFINLYNRMEELLEERLGVDNSNKVNVVIRFTQTRQGKRYKTDLNLCREVRNLLSHHADKGGKPVVEPADELLTVLRSVIAELAQPPLALDYATQPKDVLMTSPTRYVLPLMRQMEEKGLSHIPVWEDGKMAGVFSHSTVFRYLTDHPDAKLTETTEVKEFTEYIPFAKHSERYLFEKADLTYWEAKDLFNQVYKNKRLAVIYITDTGKAKGRLLGLLSPWDVLGLEETVE